MCRHDSRWLPTVMNFVQKSFQLGEAVMDKIYQGLSEEVYLGESAPAATINHHHVLACGDTIEVKYDALYLKSRLQSKDASVLEKFISGGIRHTDDETFLSGFGANLDQS